MLTKLYLFFTKLLKGKLYDLAVYYINGPREPQTMPCGTQILVETSPWKYRLGGDWQRSHPCIVTERS